MGYKTSLVSKLLPRAKGPTSPLSNHAELHTNAHQGIVCTFLCPHSNLHSVICMCICVDEQTSPFLLTHHHPFPVTSALVVPCGYKGKTFKRIFKE